MNLCVLASGRGSNLTALLRASSSGKMNSRVVLVISNNSSAGALKVSLRRKIVSAHLSEEAFKSHSEYVKKFISILRRHKIDLILLAGYMKKIPKEIVSRYRNRILNIHPSLLPAFGGKGMYGMNVHRAVIDSGVRLSGVTVHIVNEKYDAGPIVIQKAVSVDDNETPESLKKKVQVLEHRLYPYAVKLFESRKISVKNNRVYFS